LRQGNKTPLSYNELIGWADDDLSAAFSSYLRSKPHQAVSSSARQFFENDFAPYEISKGGGAHFTGYFEPELRGSRTRQAGFETPIYELPSDLTLTREDIVNGALRDQGLELCWLQSDADAFFLQVQGSGRVSLTDGTNLRVGYAGKNNQPYRSIGQIAVKQGLFTFDNISAEKLKHWIKSNPADGFNLLLQNPSYVFFKILHIQQSDGPIGTAKCSLTPLRSLAVDPEFIPLGTPVWVEFNGINTLMIAQDTGSAIKGPDRADIFFGTGYEAGLKAGEINLQGRLVVLLPKAM